MHSKSIIITLRIRHEKKHSLKPKTDELSTQLWDSNSNCFRYAFALELFVSYCVFSVLLFTTLVATNSFLLFCFFFLVSCKHSIVVARTLQQATKLRSKAGAAPAAAAGGVGVGAGAGAHTFGGWDFLWRLRQTLALLHELCKIKKEMKTRLVIVAYK